MLFALAKSDPQAQSRLALFRGELQKLGWADITMDTRYAASNDAETLQRYAKELVALQPDLLIAQNTDATDALLQLTRIIPIIFTVVADPIGSGFVASFPRPGGNVTGFATSEPTMGGKWLDRLPPVSRKLNPADSERLLIRSLGSARPDAAFPHVASEEMSAPAPAAAHAGAVSSKEPPIETARLNCRNDGFVSLAMRAVVDAQVKPGFLRFDTRQDQWSVAS